MRNNQKIPHSDVWFIIAKYQPTIRIRCNENKTEMADFAHLRFVANENHLLQLQMLHSLLQIMRIGGRVQPGRIHIGVSE